MDMWGTLTSRAVGINPGLPFQEVKAVDGRCLGGRMEVPHGPL